MTESLARRTLQRSIASTSPALLLILVAASILRFLALGTVSLIGDESYYWLWSRLPAWAYYDHPAGVALLIRASTAVGGSTPFGIRWLNALTGVGCVVLTWVVGEQLLSRRAALFSAAAVAVGAPFLVTSRFVYTDTLTLFLMLLNLLAFWRFARTKADIADGLAFGLTLGLLFNTKYSAYVYALALAAALLLDHRHLLSTPRLWVSASVAALGLVPVIAWNARHDWASFRWQLSHVTQATLHPGGLLARTHHAWIYLTGPLALLAAAGLGRFRTPAERLLTILALFLFAPVALSPMNSPRNLMIGLVPLLLLVGTRLPPVLTSAAQRFTTGALSALLLGVALFGTGTFVSLIQPSPLPHSSVVPAIRRDAAGWEALGEILGRSDKPVFALDYSIAAQIRYYTGRPAFTSWGQYRLWGIPPLHDATIVALDYLDPEFVTDRLRDGFQQVEGPERLSFSEPGATKVVYVWQASGVEWDQDLFLERFDFLALLDEEG